MKVNRRLWGTSVVRARILAAGLVLAVVGYAILSLASRSHQATAATNSAGQSAFGSILASNTPLPQEAPSLVQARSVLAGLPLVFEPNQGQSNLDPSDSRARFMARGSGYSIFLGSEGATLSLVSKNQPQAKRDGSKNLRVDSVEMKLKGANTSAAISPSSPLPGKSNYLIGQDSAKWRTGVPQFARVQYQDVYPGIDLVFYGNEGRLEYDFQVKPGADPSRAELEFNGARQIRLDNGALVIETAGQDIRLEAPRVYQEVDGQKKAIAGNFVLRGDRRAGFSIGAYDRSRELIIDPILSFSTYFGGSGDELSTSVAVDGSFNIYLTGSTTSPNLPAVGTYQTTLNGTQNVYVAKITPPLGSIVAALDYVTYLGGTGIDGPAGIAVDGAGDAYVAGTTTSPNFPVTPITAYQSAPETSSPAGSQHAFVTELNPKATTLAYSTYLSGNGVDVASGMTIDAQGNVYVTGTTTSTDQASSTDMFPASGFPEALAFQQFSRSSIQFFVTKVNTAATKIASIPFSTYFGGGTFETTNPVALGGGIAVDANGNIYFSGTTNFTYTGCAGCGTTDFPILDAYQPCLDQPPPTTIINPPTCTNSSSQTSTDAFVAKINPLANQGQQLLWSTYLGGSSDDSSTGVAVDPAAANVYVVGTTNSWDFVATSTLASFASYQKCLNNNPLTTAGTQPTCTAQTNAPTDAFVARVSNPTNTTGTPVNVSLGYFSYLGGANNETGTAITVDNASGALITGSTQSPFVANTPGTFPLNPNPNSIQGALNGTQDAFVARINTAAALGQTTIASWANYFGGSGIDTGTGIALDVNQNTYLAGETNSTDLQVNKPIPGYSTNSGGYDAFVAQLGTAVSLSVQGTISLGTNQQFIPAGTPATFTYTVTNNGPDLASGINVSDNFSTSITGIPLTFVSASVSSGVCGGVSSASAVSCTLNTLNSGATATVTIVLTPTPNSTGSQATFNGGTVQVASKANIVYAQTSVPALMSDYSMTVNPVNQSVPQAGDTAFFTVQLTPHPLYPTSISLTCAGLPTGAACGWSPGSSISLQGASGASATLSISTTARPIPIAANRLFPRILCAVGITFPGLFFIAGIGGDKRRRKILGILTLCSLLCLVVLIPACSHNNQQAPATGTPPGNSNVTVTATAGSDTKSQTIILTVP